MTDHARGRRTAPVGRSVLLWGLPALATLTWLLVVIANGLGGRVAGHWASALTMLFGSFLAGSSPEGGGAVAFPVFTKALHVPSAAARTFGLCIQAVGMTMAVASIMIARRPVHLRSAIVGTVAAITGFLVILALGSDPDSLFWRPTLPTPWIKATFSIVLATTSVLMVRHLRHGDHHDETAAWTRRHDYGVAVIAFAGGALSALTGTGANILVFLFLVALVDVNPKVALPTAIIVMAAVSIVGMVVLGLIDGQLDVQVLGDRVESVGGQPTDLPASEADVFGLWMAAVPVVVWGAPLGSLAASMVKESWLVRFVAVLAAVEVATTFILVPELRTSPALMTYLAVGLLLLPAMFLYTRQRRALIFGGPPLRTGVGIG